MNTFPRVALMSFFMSARRTPNPRPSMQATTSKDGFPARSRSSRISARCVSLVCLSRAVPSSLVNFASITTAGVNSSGTMKSGAWSNPLIRSARPVFRWLIPLVASCCSMAFSIKSPTSSDTASRWLAYGLPR